ncbi:SUKH-4 family immunity protein [Streptomyces sp. NPDC013181]|uniref:SUKH-4 family immunity protein n=1 Tax=Streptomyces sp. NPDC013181 TaxID=3364864 RepID=UPI003680B8DC
MIRIFGPALAPVLQPHEIPEGLTEEKARWTLQHLGVPTSIGDVVVTDLHSMVPVGEFLTGLELPPWARSKNILKLGLFLDGFICLDGVDGAVLLLTRELEEAPPRLADDLESFVSALVSVSEATARRRHSPETDIHTLKARVAHITHGTSDVWERMIESLMG